MARLGKDAELLVERLEKLLANFPVEIKSPDYIVGKMSKSKPREIDISVRGKVGSTNIFIILECRKRKDKDDVSWIDQLATKREDVGADKAIAVSSSGFSEGAINMAMQKGIELRLLQNLDATAVQSWFGVGEFPVFHRQYRIVGTPQLDIDTQEAVFSNYNVDKQSYKAQIIVKASQIETNVSEILRAVLQKNSSVWETIEISQQPIRKNIAINIDQSAELELRIEGFSTDIRRVLLTVEFWVEPIPTSIETKILGYQALDGETIAQVVEVTLPSPHNSAESITLTHHRIAETKETFVSVASKTPVVLEFIDVTHLKK